MTDAPKKESFFDIAVIGAGGAGQMAMLRTVLNHLKTVVFLGDFETSRMSREAWVASVENIPGFFSRGNPIGKTTEETIQFIEKRPALAPFLTLVKQSAQSIKKEGDAFVISTNNLIHRQNVTLEIAMFFVASG